MMWENWGQQPHKTQVRDFLEHHKLRLDSDEISDEIQVRHR